MSEIKKMTLNVDESNLGQVQITDEVVAIIAGLAATEVEGVSSMAGNITNELVSKLGMKNLSKGVRISMMDKTVLVDLTLNLMYGYSVPDVAMKVQDRVSTAIENMTGLSVAQVDVRVADISISKNA